MTLFLKLASILYRFLFPVYRILYFTYKWKKDLVYLKTLSRLIKADSVILDIGANIGFYGKFFSDVAGKGHVYCCEPDASNFRHLQRELKAKTNVTLIQKAISEKPERLKLFRSKLLNVDHRTYSHDSSVSFTEVEATSIDEFTGGKIKPDLIKLDIQGFELNAFKGMERTVERNPDLVLFFELWPYGLKSAGTSADELYHWLSVRNFKLYKCTFKGLTQVGAEEIQRLKIDYWTDLNIFASKRDFF